MKRIELYREETKERARIRQKRAGIAMLAVAGAGLLLCILWCALTTRKNDGVMLPLTIGTSILTGWIVIFLSHALYDDAKSMVRHSEAIAEGERKTVSGRFTKTGEVYRIRHGVTVRRVHVDTGERELTLNVCEALSKELPDSFSGTAETVFGFLAACEVNADD